VHGYGRNIETTLLRKYYLRTNWFRALGMIPLVLKLIARGRLHFFGRKIEGLDDLRKMMAAIRENGKK
jgi:hypothetical protein